MASKIQRIEEKKRLSTPSPTGWASKKPVEEVRSDLRLVKLLSLDCKDGNAGVCIVLPPSARMRVGREVLHSYPSKALLCDSFGSQWRDFLRRGSRLVLAGNDTNCRIA